MNVFVFKMSRTKDGVNLGRAKQGAGSPAGTTGELSPCREAGRGCSAGREQRGRGLRAAQQEASESPV